MKIREILTDMEQFIYTTEALNQILVAADCPEDVRSLIDYLIGFSMGREEFKAFDGELSIYVQTGKRRGKESAANQWISHTRKKLIDWQDKSGAGFVIHNEGDFDKNTGKKLRATYQLPILTLIENVMNKAQENIKIWDKNPSLAIALAAEELVQIHKDDPLTSILNVPRYVKPPHVVIGQNVKLAVTAFKKALLQKDNPRLKHLDDPNNTIEELEDLLEDLKDLYNEKKF
jgi:hypothetical protein